MINIFEIGKGKEMDREEFVGIQRLAMFMVVVGLILIATSNAEVFEDDFESRVTVDINTGSNLMWVVIEGSNHSFSISNSTNSYTIDYEKNVSCTDATTRNLTNTITSLSSTCNKIAQAYDDASSYYKPLLDCTSQKIQYETEKNNAIKEREELKPFKSNYESCINEKIALNGRIASLEVSSANLQNQLNSTSIKLNSTRSTSTLYLWIAIIAAVVAIYLFRKDRTKEAPPPLQGTAALGEN